MTQPDTSTRSLIVEKEFPHPPEKVWRALTESSLIEQWLMKNDFQPVAGHSFSSAQGTDAELERRHRLPGARRRTLQDSFLHLGHLRP